MYGLLVRRLYFRRSDFTGLLNFTWFFFSRLLYSIFWKKKEKKNIVVLSFPFLMSLGNHPATLYIVANSNWLEGGGRQAAESEREDELEE